MPASIIEVLIWAHCFISSGQCSGVEDLSRPCLCGSTHWTSPLLLLVFSGLQKCVETLHSPLSVQPLSHSPFPCISPLSCLCCDFFRQWQREKRTGRSLASTIGWTWANHCWRSVAVSVHCRQLVGGGFRWQEHIVSANGRACWIYSSRIRLLLIHRHFYQVYPYCQQHTVREADALTKMNTVKFTHTHTHLHACEELCLSPCPVCLKDSTHRLAMSFLVLCIAFSFPFASVAYGTR